MLLRLIIFRLQNFLPIFPYGLTPIVMFPRLQVPMCNSRLLRPRLRNITLLTHTVTDITLSRMAVALAAILVPYFGSLSEIYYDARSHEYKLLLDTFVRTRHSHAFSTKYATAI